MKIIKTIAEINEKLNSHTNVIPKIGLIIGNFDGLHIGHQNLLREVLIDCRKNNLQLVVMTFIPHPVYVLNHTVYPFLINTYAERRKLFSQFFNLEESNVGISINYLLEYEFDQKIVKLTANEFMNKYIFNSGVKVEKIFFGHDFSLGANKEGTFQYISDLCKPQEIQTKKMNATLLSGLERPISSSYIRELLIAGQVEKANELLGRKYFIEGKVIHGKGIGSKEVVATANITAQVDKLLPGPGVYITQTKWQGKLYSSVTNLGVNPTYIQDNNGLKIETHILDFSCDLYEQEIQVSFMKKIRNEVRFESPVELVNQIHKDIEICREYFLITDKR